MHNQSLVLIPPVCALSPSSRVHGPYKVFAKFGVSQFTNFCVASCHCVAPCPCLASCNRCHDPFIVRSAKTRPPFTGFTQIAYPSRCSRSTRTTVCFYARASSRVSVFTSSLQPVTRSIMGSSPSSCSGVWDPWSVGIPILQTCNAVVVLKQRLASFQHLRSSSPKALS